MHDILQLPPLPREFLPYVELQPSPSFLLLAYELKQSDSSFSPHTLPSSSLISPANNLKLLHLNLNWKRLNNLLQWSSIQSLNYKAKWFPAHSMPHNKDVPFRFCKNISIFWESMRMTLNNESNHGLHHRLFGWGERDTGSGEETRINIKLNKRSLITSIPLSLASKIAFLVFSHASTAESFF